MKHTKLFILITTLSLLLCACSSTPTSKQTRNDLTSEHFNGLSADMNRSDVEDLIGKSDSALAENESFEMYSLADGTVALLRYAGDKLQAAYIRGKDNVERAIFSNYADGSNTINDGTMDDGMNDNDTENNSDDNTSDDSMSDSNMSDTGTSDSNTSDNTSNDATSNNPSGAQGNTSANPDGNNTTGNTTGNQTSGNATDYQTPDNSDMPESGTTVEPRTR